MHNRRRPARRSVRNSNHDATPSAIIKRYGLAPEYAHVTTVPYPELPNEADVRAFGPLVWLEVERFDGKKEFWDFAAQPNHVTDADRQFMPRVFYDRRNEQYWFVGGVFQVDGKGFHRTKKGPCAAFKHRACDLDAAKRKHRAQNDDYASHHGGLEPHECAEAEIVFPERVICVGRCLAAAYEANRNNGKGLVNYRHEMAEDHPESERHENLPFVDVSESGCRVFLRGGSMRVKDGWMID
jgi:hypothetical protein